MNLNPDPSQEGNCCRAPAVLLPSREGSGVGRFMGRTPPRTFCALCAPEPVRIRIEGHCFVNALFNSAPHRSIASGWFRKRHGASRHRFQHGQCRWVGTRNAGEMTEHFPPIESGIAWPFPSPKRGRRCGRTASADRAAISNGGSWAGRSTGACARGLPSILSSALVD